MSSLVIFRFYLYYCQRRIRVRISRISSYYILRISTILFIYFVENNKLTSLWNLLMPNPMFGGCFKNYIWLDFWRSSRFKLCTQFSNNTNIFYMLRIFIPVSHSDNVGIYGRKLYEFLYKNRKSPTWITNKWRICQINLNSISYIFNSFLHLYN